MLSGLIGALVGAIASYWAARSQTTRILEADRAARIAVAAEERALMREADSRAAASEALDALYGVQHLLLRVRPSPEISLAMRTDRAPEIAAIHQALNGLKRAVRVTAARLDSLRLRQLLEVSSGLAGQYANMMSPNVNVIGRAMSDVDAFLTWAQKCLHVYLETGVDPFERVSSIPKPNLHRADMEVWTAPEL